MACWVICDVLAYCEDYSLIFKRNLYSLEPGLGRWGGGGKDNAVALSHGV